MLFRLNSVCCSMLPAKDITVTEKNEQRLGIKVEHEQALEVAAEAATTLAEANLISVMCDAELLRPAKRRKIENQVKRLEQWSQAFKIDVHASGHKRVMSESMAVFYSK